MRSFVYLNLKLCFKIDFLILILSSKLPFMIGAPPWFAFLPTLVDLDPAFVQL